MKTRYTKTQKKAEDEALQNDREGAEGLILLMNVIHSHEVLYVLFIISKEIVVVPLLLDFQLHT